MPASFGARLTRAERARSRLWHAPGTRHQPSRNWASTAHLNTSVAQRIRPSVWQQPMEAFEWPHKAGSQHELKGLHWSPSSDRGVRMSMMASLTSGTEAGRANDFAHQAGEPPINVLLWMVRSRRVGGYEDRLSAGGGRKATSPDAARSRGP